MLVVVVDNVDICRLSTLCDIVFECFDDWRWSIGDSLLRYQCVSFYHIGICPNTTIKFTTHHAAIPTAYLPTNNFSAKGYPVRGTTNCETIKKNFFVDTGYCPI